MEEWFSDYRAGFVLSFPWSAMVHQDRTGANGPEKRWLNNLFETFYGMWRTTYRIEEALALLDRYRREAPDFATEADEAIEALEEYKGMYAQNRTEA